MSWGLPSPYYESHASHQEAKHTSNLVVVLVLVWAGPFICCVSVQVATSTSSWLEP
jgi:hypothetical protein